MFQGSGNSRSRVRLQSDVSDAFRFITDNVFMNEAERLTRKSLSNQFAKTLFMIVKEQIQPLSLYEEPNVILCYFYNNDLPFSQLPVTDTQWRQND